MYNTFYKRRTNLFKNRKTGRKKIQNKAFKLKNARIFVI